MAVVATTEGIVLVSLATAKSETVIKGSATWCAVDNRARVIWSLTNRNETFSLDAWDIDTRAGFTVVKDVPRIDEVIIDHGTAGRLGGQDPVEFRVALRLTMSDKPQIGPKIGCDGDAYFNCYEEREGDAGKLVLQDEIKKLQDRLSKLTFHGYDRVRALVKRSRGSLWSAPSKVKIRQKIRAVARSRCDEEPDDCGRAYVLPGTPYWLVTTANSRGDFYHADHQLYDPRTEKFIDPEAPARRSPKPLPDGSAIEDVHVAPSGKGVLIGGKVIRLGRGVVFSRGEKSCGWVGGGWHIGGPRDDHYL